MPTPNFLLEFCIYLQFVLFPVSFIKDYELEGILSGTQAPQLPSPSCEEADFRLKQACSNRWQALAILKIFSPFKSAVFALSCVVGMATHGALQPACADPANSSQPLVGTVESLEFRQPGGAPPTAPPILRLTRPQTTVSVPVGGASSVSPAASPFGSALVGFVDNSALSLGATKSRVVKPDVFRAWIEKSQPTLMGGISSHGQNEIVEVAGQWDRADRALAAFGLPYTHIKANALTPQMLSGTKVLIINCAGSIKRDRLQTIRDFVNRGGYLLTTDWALDNMLSNTFPGYLEWNKGKNKQPIYEAHYISPDRVLAPHTVAKAFWKLDEEAHTVRVLNREKVRVLVTSSQLAAEDPDRQGVLACIFPFGRGFVLHMVGHFDNNAKIPIGNFLPDSSDAIGISLRQAIAANFVAAGLSGERIEN